MVTLRVLGPIELTGGRDPGEILSRPRDLALLAYLATTCGDGAHCSRDQLLAVFWPESDVDRARNSLKQALHRIRQATAPHLITRRGTRDIGLASHEIESDIERFREAFAARDHESALACYRGELLEGFHIPNASGFEPWLDRERSRVATAAALCGRSLCETAGKRMDLRAALQWARRTAEISNRDEADVRRLLELLVRSGDRTGAVRYYEDYERWLKVELELSPSPETEAVVANVRFAQRPSVPVATSGSASARDPAGTATVPSAESVPSPAALSEDVTTAGAIGAARRSWQRRWSRMTAAAAMLVVVAAGVVNVERARAARSAVPAEAVAFYERGLAYLETGRERDRERNWRLAVEMLDRAVEVSPDFARAHAALGMAHLRLFHWGFDRTTARQVLSRSTIERSLALDPSGHDGVMARGWYFEWGEQDHERALVEGTRALERKPDDADAATLVFAASRRLGRAQEAIPVIKRSVSLSSQTVSLRRELVSTYIGLRDYTAAAQLLDESLQLFPGDPGLYHYKWLASLLSSGTRAAEGVLREAVTQGVAADFLWLLEFELQWLNRNYDGALRVLQRENRTHFHIQAGDFPVALLFGMVHRLRGKEELARAAYERAVPDVRSMLLKRPDDPWIHGWLAVALAGAGDRTEALSQLKLASDLLELRPDPWASPYLAQEVFLHAYLMSGARDQAVALLTRLLQSQHYAALSRRRLEVDPRFDALRGDTQLQHELVARFPSDRERHAR